ncbi:hypothetical protein [Rhodococcus rhodochrous]|uniref:hypothetical protein n=1 Tax=Rhodococcus rhodochrous TaxID=1829 RepID=UPI001D023E1B|nr:hypothetical protein [Rhodococcus rhodochrous]
MTEQNTTDSTHEKHTPSLDAENERASSATKLTIGLAAWPSSSSSVSWSAW